MKKRKLGDKQYRHGVEFALPTGDGEITKLTFRGAFDRRQLRKMLKNSLVANITTEQADYLIDNYSTRLRRMTMEEIIAQAENA